MIDRGDHEDDARRIRSRPRTIGEYFAAEQSLLVPLPEEPFETGGLSTPRVDRYSQICVRMNRYSVPVRLIGRTVRVMLHASELVVYDGREEVARRERLITVLSRPGGIEAVLLGGEFVAGDPAAFRTGPGAGTDTGATDGSPAKAAADGSPGQRLPGAAAQHLPGAGPDGHRGTGGGSGWCTGCST